MPAPPAHWHGNGFILRRGLRTGSRRCSQQTGEQAVVKKHEQNEKLLLMLVTAKRDPSGNLIYGYEPVGLKTDVFRLEYWTGLVLPTELLERIASQPEDPALGVNLWPNPDEN